MKPIGWFAMISLSEPGAGMNQPSSGTPSREGKVTSENSSPCSAGECSSGDRAWWLIPTMALLLVVIGLITVGQAAAPYTLYTLF